MRKKIKVLNLARFIAIKGLRPENDISLKIYYYLREKYGVESLFVKSVIRIPFWAALLKSSLMKKRKMYRSDDYVDENYDIPVKFFGEQFYLLSKISKSSLYKIPFQYKLLKGDLYKEIKKFKPDLIHAHTAFPEGYYSYKIYKSTGIPYILTLRGEYSKRYESKIYNKILSNAAQVHTPSAALYSQLKNIYPVELQPHPLESIWLEDVETKQFETLNLITVSRLLEMKNIDIVLKAVRYLHESGHTITYTIVGDGTYRSELEKLSGELAIDDIVSFEGYKTHEEIKEYYSRSNIFVMLSRPETYGRVYFEAAAQGLVVIGSKSTGADGHLSDEEGIFIDESVENLVHILKQTNKDEFNKISQNARKRVKKLTIEKIIERYFKIIDNSSI